MTEQRKSNANLNAASEENLGYLQSTNKVDPNKLREVIEIALQEGIVNVEEKEEITKVIVGLSSSINHQHAKEI